ncbi:Peptidase C48, SUMO/Sentrin/Ubl1 [Cynara cardunculus var. scolymus]|uniref:Peptidase C48, SUMO/Sentrin/Ubl1 n=1 Tax=Cynara cardunculus var. scolymus TaxID=59895 RepID=A0A118JV61_CYNCS|nr:Peptidase C48, SUMO/Sentrin/Ubl1 [Cynara cardunculus var. scolymus]
MELKVVNGGIPITIESIHKLLGLRMGGVDILEMDEVEDSKNMTTTWRKQFDKKKMRPKDIMKIMQSSRDAGFNFKLNFLVLFVNLMVECNRMGCCNFGFLSRIESEDVIPGIDWCKYIYGKIKTSKSRWRRDSRMCFYAGPLTYLALLYVEATISPKVVVEHKGHAISAWNLDLLKKRQSTEIKDGGFGLLPIRSNAESSEDVHHRYASNQENIGETSTPKNLSKEDHVQRILVKIAVVLSARVEAEMEIKEAMSKFPEEEEFKQYKKQLDDMFNEGACNMTHDTHSSGLKDHSTAKSDRHPSLDIVVSQPSGFNEKTLPTVWLSPGFIEAVDKVVENTISTSKTKRPYAAITPPKFDLGIIPITQSKPLSMVFHEEAECIERCPSVERYNVSEDAKKYKVERASRRELKLGDHLRSPFVIRAVELNVTPEERKIHEWVVAGLGGNELLFSTPNDTKLHRHAVESLGRTTTINGDSKLISKNVNHNTQYALFNKGLLSSAKNNWEVVQMRNVDLVFFPLLDKGHYYIVVFNLKNPSVVVIDNIYQEVSDDDQHLQMYDFIIDILQILMIMHLNAVGYPVGRELDEIGQERLRMDWQTQNNFDDCGVFAMRHMETYMGDV